MYVATDLTAELSRKTWITYNNSPHRKKEGIYIPTTIFLFNTSIYIYLYAVYKLLTAQWGQQTKDKYVLLEV